MQDVNLSFNLTSHRLGVESFKQFFFCMNLLHGLVSSVTDLSIAALFLQKCSSFTTSRVRKYPLVSAGII